MSCCVDFYFEWMRVKLIDVISCNIFCLTLSEGVCAGLILLIYVYKKRYLHAYDRSLFCGETRRSNLKFFLKLDASLHLLEISDMLANFFHMEMMINFWSKSQNGTESLWPEICTITGQRKFV